MENCVKFLDILAERRKDCDIQWVSRPMDPLSPHKLPTGAKFSRNKIIDAVLKVPRVLSVMKEMTSTEGLREIDIERKARSILEEMASKADLATIRWIAIFITKALKQILLSIRINEDTFMNIRKGMQIAEVQYIYVPTHRSYLDFILISYILFSYNMALPNIASGMDFYQMRIIGELLRKTGAFYMRRSFSSDRLYKEIFRVYVNTIIEHSDRAIEFFIEGTRSRSQKSLSPKYGFLANTLESLYHGNVPDIHYIPISISYDRPLEELLFAYELLGIPKPAESTSGLLRSLSILREPFAYGHVYIHIAPPIHAQDYIDFVMRTEHSINPYSKLPMAAVKSLANSIINSHKKYTVITPFNIVALLFNENVQSFPNQPYTLEMLLRDYNWMKTILMDSLGATVSPRASNMHKTVEDETEYHDIQECLKIHTNLLVLDSNNVLKLKERHKGPILDKHKHVKGHSLNEQTMRITIPVINIMTYVNPAFAFLTKPAIIALALQWANITKDEAFEVYRILRNLLSTEFAMPAHVTEPQLDNEWQEGLALLIKQNCIKYINGSFVSGDNPKLMSLLCNLILPYIAAVYMTCSTILQWNESTMGPPVHEKILKETQKQTERLLISEDKFIRHPYTLSLDLYSTTITSLIALEAVSAIGDPCVYHGNRVQLAILLLKLEKILIHHPPGSYLKICLINDPELASTRAKL